MNRPHRFRPRRYGLHLADLRRDRTRSHGIINYALGLARALPATLSDDEDLVVYANPAIQDELEQHGGVEGASIRLLDAPGGTPGRLALDHVGVLRAARRDRVEVMHFPKGFLPVWRPEWPAFVATMHDDITVRYARGELGGRPERGPHARYFLWSTRHTLRQAHQICTVSAFSRDRIHALAAEAGIGAPPPVTVTHQASSLPSLSPLPRAAKEPWLLHIGSSLPHKRTGDAVRWAARYLARRELHLQLVVTGSVEPGVADLVRRSGGRVIEGTLSSAELADLLHRSRALLFSSSYEGFGLPPLEAYLLGTPVVYADAAAVVEVLDGAVGGYAASQGYGGFAQALDAVLALDDDEVARVRENLQNRFSWAATAGKTLEAYRSAAKALDR